MKKQKDLVSILPLLEQYPKEAVLHAYKASTEFCWDDEYEECYDEENRLTDVLVKPGTYNLILLSLDMNFPSVRNKAFRLKMEDL